MANGDIYNGEFKGNVIEGVGVYTWKANGHTYEGNKFFLNNSKLEFLLWNQSLN